MRPVMVAIQDLYSGKILAWRMGRRETTGLVLLAFMDLLREYGILGHAWFDNGRAFRSKRLVGPAQSGGEVNGGHPGGQHLTGEQRTGGSFSGRCTQVGAQVGNQTGNGRSQNAALQQTRQDTHQEKAQTPYDAGTHVSQPDIPKSHQSGHGQNPQHQAGILPLLGVRVHRTLPYSGQSKPIERAFRDFCDAIAKHPLLAGAYTGNSPSSQPANYGSRDKRA